MRRPSRAGRPHEPPSVDLERIRSGLARLDSIAREHPEAFARLGGSEDAWVRAQDAEELIVGRKKLDPKAGAFVAVTVRLSPTIVEDIDAVTEELAASAAGLKVTRSDTVRVLVTEALRARERGSHGRRRTRNGRR